MQKVLGQDIKDLKERKSFLVDNADKVVQMEYHKPFTGDELAVMKTDFANKHIRIANLEEQIKKFKDEINIELKPLKEEAIELRENLRSKGKIVNENVYQFLDEEEKMVGFYNAEGVLISSRPATSEELQRTIYAEIRKEGTNN